MQSKLICECKSPFFRVTVIDDHILLDCVACNGQSKLSQSGWCYTQGHRQANERARAHDDKRAETLASNGPEPIDVVSPQARWHVINGDAPKITDKLEDLYLSARTRKCMSRIGAKYVCDVMIYSASELLRLPNFGRKSLKEITELLEASGHTVGEFRDVFGADLPSTSHQFEKVRHFYWPEEEAIA